jgi:hypothetical protein
MLPSTANWSVSYPFLEVGKLKLTLTSYCRAMRKEGESGVTAEPELEGNVHHLGVDGDITSDGHTGDGLGHGECGVVTDEGVVKGVASGLGELVPDVEPLTVVLVDLLTTDLNLDGGDESVTDKSTGEQEPWIPVSLMAGISTRRYMRLIRSPLREMVESHLLTEADGSGERLLNGLERS